jgi:hypothetical protein
LPTKLSPAWVQSSFACARYRLLLRPRLEITLLLVWHRHLQCAGQLHAVMPSLVHTCLLQRPACWHHLPSLFGAQVLLWRCEPCPLNERSGDNKVVSVRCILGVRAPCHPCTQRSCSSVAHHAGESLDGCAIPRPSLLRRVWSGSWPHGSNTESKHHVFGRLRSHTNAADHNSLYHPPLLGRGRAR